MEYLIEAARSFHFHGYSNDALTICHNDSASSNPEVHAMELEILGSLKQPADMWSLIDQVTT